MKIEVLNTVKAPYFLLILLSFLFSQIGFSAELKSGKQVYDTVCLGCHGTGVLSSPKFGSKADWKKVEAKGFKVLQKNAINGYKNMPAKGGNAGLKNEEIKRAIAYILSKSGFKKYATQAGKSTVKKKTKKSKKLKVTTKSKSYKNINRFNRLMKPASEWNPPPMSDGIHDASNPGTEMLQTPKSAFESLPKSKSGNRVDWVKSLSKGDIAPRNDRLDPNVQPVIMDLNIVREVKGSMPNVVYPHKQHTQWLDCSNCHPAIFIPQKGANQISMAAILLGQKCGVCHGKVAFPVSECRRCHSQKKSSKTAKK
ncbi:Putative cytochrome c [hydrothermal vent metagenome]|uniref:Cytochrome c n=1 Tax=hydrothermal vent metagenome TaxID=652676 RepID=A0A3B1ABK9_9ZZZZ